MIKPMVVVAVLLGVHVTLGGGCGNSEHLVQFQRNELSSEMFQDFMVFVPGVTQGNEEAGSFQDFILFFWCESGELEGRGNPRFSCVTPVVGAGRLQEDGICNSSLVYREVVEVRSDGKKSYLW